MKLLICSDTHFDDKERNLYRWGLLDFLKTTCKENNIKHVLICGDVFNEKDKHPSSLINKFIDYTLSLLEVLDELWLLKGNHDGINPDNPYLRWINNIDKIKYFINPTNLLFNNKNLLFLPSTRNPTEEWAELDLSKATYIFAHQTFSGCTTENGMILEGVSPSIFDCTNAKVYSGDIHVPQKLSNGKITYIGAPYPINFGDSFTARCLNLDIETGDEKDIYFKCINKHKLLITKPEDLQNLDLKANDQLNIEVIINNITDWVEYKSQINKFCKDNKLQLNDLVVKKSVESLAQNSASKIKFIDNMDVFKQYCKKLKISDEFTNYGKSILDQVK